MSKIKRDPAKDLKRIIKTIKRDRMLDQGAYDGRFATKTIPNKKRLIKKWKFNPKIDE